MNSKPHICYRPKYCWIENEIKEGFQIAVNQKGQIVDCQPVKETSDSKENVVLLKDQVLFPGLVNAHSHAFQRSLRGFTQIRSPKGKDHFWTWREAMYKIANALSPEDIYLVAAFCFLEMIASGITTVGEFHYLHHLPSGETYQNSNELGLQVLRAARDVGIRICLLDVAYEKGEMKRFCDESIDSYLKRIDLLQKELGEIQSMGIAPHSIRAVSLLWLKEIAKYNSNRNFPIHMHLHEQPKEIEMCAKEYSGKTPLEVVFESGLMNHSLTAVHATHTLSKDQDLLQENKVMVCACPSTERDLGDGILDALALAKRNISICLGTDSQVMINLWEDARELEYHLRLKTLERNVLNQHPAHFLIKCMTSNGSKALGLKVGELQKGAPADMVSIDLNHLSLIGHSPKTLPSQMIFSLALGAIKNVWVNGKQVFKDGRHPKQEVIQKEFQTLQYKINSLM